MPCSLYDLPMVHAMFTVHTGCLSIRCQSRGAICGYGTAGISEANPPGYRYSGEVRAADRLFSVGTILTVAGL